MNESQKVSNEKPSFHQEIFKNWSEIHRRSMYEDFEKFNKIHEIEQIKKRNYYANKEKSLD